MQSLLFIAVAIALYFAADRVLDALERRAGRRFESRSIIFFGLLLGFALLAFPLIRHLLPS